MSEDVVRAAAAYAFESSPAQDEYKFLWHAGEPLTAGVEFYETAFSIIADVAPPNTSIIHSIQTNGTLVDDRWCEFFNEYQVRIGLSIDGPAELHDANRRSWSGGPSHSRVMRGYERLRQHGMSVGAIAVLTLKSLDQPDAIFDFFKNAGFTALAFNVEEAEGVHKQSSLRDSDPDLMEKYREFLRVMWRRWRDGDRKMQIREFYQELVCIRANCRSTPPSSESQTRYCPWES